MSFRLDFVLRADFRSPDTTSTVFFNGERPGSIEVIFLSS